MAGFFYVLPPCKIEKIIKKASMAFFSVIFHIYSVAYPTDNYWPAAYHVSSAKLLLKGNAMNQASDFMMQRDKKDRRLSKPLPPPYMTDEGFVLIDRRENSDRRAGQDRSANASNTEFGHAASRQLAAA